MKRSETPAASDFPLPSGVPTSLTIPEMRLLQRYAREAGTVLEIGTYYGYSAIGMALAGADVTSVDPHKPDLSAAMDTKSPYEDTWEPFLANCERCAVPAVWPAGELDWERLTLPRMYIQGGMGSVIAIREPIESVDLATESFGLVFIDGDHSHPAPMRDARIALAHLRPPGYVAFHDVTPIWMDVWLTVKELERTGELVKVAQERYLAVYQVRASSVSGRSSTPQQA